MSILKYSRYSHILFVAMACLLPSLASCTDEDLPDNAAPSLSVQEAANVLRTSVVLNGSITGATNQVKTYGFQYSESENFPADRTTDVPMQDEGLPQGGNVTKQVKDLTPNETYYYRLYASTGATTVYSKSVQFRTANMSSPQIANIVTDSIGERVVRISFDIEDYGNEVLIEVGLGYKKSDSKTFIPVAADELTADDHYTVQITGLDADTQYDFRPYAKNAADKEASTGSIEGYGEIITQKTAALLSADVTTIEVVDDNIGINSVKVAGKVESAKGSDGEISGCGFVWSATVKSPTLEFCDGSLAVKPEYDMLPFTFAADITSLDQSTTYYICAYATNYVDGQERIAYGEVREIETKGLAKPQVEITKTTNEDGYSNYDIETTATTIQVRVNIKNYDSYACAERGVIWSKSTADVTLDNAGDNKIAVVTDSRLFTALIENLEVGSSYYVRGYAINKAGDQQMIGYTDAVNCSTSSFNRPSLEQVEVNEEKITRNSAEITGKISSAGNGTITERGFVLSLMDKNYSPTLDNCDLVVVSDESFTSVAQGLQPSTAYAVRSYVKSTLAGLEDVTYYPGNYVFVTKGIQWPEFNSIQTIDEERTLHSLKVSCGVASVGDGTIEEKGFCWNITSGTDESATLEKCTGSKVVTDGTDQDFSLTITDLEVNTGYRIRAYVKVKVDDEVTVCYSGETWPSTQDYNRPSVSGVSIDNEKVTRNSAELASRVSEGNVPITERGFVLSLSEVTGDPTLENCAKSVVSDETFTTTVTGLAAETNYSARAYVKCTVDDKEEVIYGWSNGFYTRSIQWPSFNNLQVSDEDRTVNSIKVTCGIGSMGDGTLQERGFCWVKDTGMGESPTLEKCTGSQAITEGTDQEFSYTIPNLEINTSYRVRAYAKMMVDNQVTVCYSGEAYTSTTDYNSPSLRVGVDEITYTSAKLAGSIEGGNMPVIEKGFVFSKEIYDVKIDNADKVIKGSDAFEASLSDLNYGTYYNVRSYAKCQKGASTVIIYSGTNQFRTADIDFITFEDFTYNSYVHSLQLSIKLSIESTEGVALKKCGFCAYYHTGEYREPTINDSKVEMDATEGGVYQLTLDKLMMSSTYLVRPYVVLTIGDKEIIYYHNSISWCNTSQYSLNLYTSNITDTTCDANVDFYGSYDLTGIEYGFIWSTDRDSDKSTWSKLKCDNLNDMKFSGTITGLASSTQYFISVYYVVNGKVQYQDGIWEFSTRRLPSQDDNGSPNIN